MVILVPAWPRLVRPTSAPSKRVHCRTCTANADLEKTVITASKHGRLVTLSIFHTCSKPSVAQWLSKSLSQHFAVLSVIGSISWIIQIYLEMDRFPMKDSPMTI